MAHGKRSADQSNHCGREFWSPRLPFAGGVGSICKQLTHSKDRMLGKKILMRELKEVVK